MRVFAFICRCFTRNYVMIFQSVVCDFQSISMKRFSVSEDDNKVGKPRQSWLCFYLMNNFGSSAKAIRKVSTHLTDEPFS